MFSFIHVVSTFFNTTAAVLNNLYMSLHLCVNLYWNVLKDLSYFGVYPSDIEGPGFHSIFFLKYNLENLEVFKNTDTFVLIPMAPKEESVLIV